MEDRCREGTCKPQQRWGVHTKHGQRKGGPNPQCWSWLPFGDDCGTRQTRIKSAVVVVGWRVVQGWPGLPKGERKRLGGVGGDGRRRIPKLLTSAHKKCDGAKEARVCLCVLSKRTQAKIKISVLVVVVCVCVLIKNQQHREGGEAKSNAQQKCVGRSEEVPG